jgi:predicted anti-sigma-YlaC factor YlaD
MTHLTESQITHAADGSLGSDDVSALDVAAHIAACDACRALVDTQVAARRVLAARPILPVRDLSAAIRATLENERPWIERLNWRRLSLRVAPIAAALTLVALFVIRTADSAAVRSGDLAESATAVDHTVASALWSGEVSEDQLLTLFLSASPDDSLSTYVPAVTKEK